MKMTSLQSLHRSMISIGSEMQQFQITTGATSFDGLFSIRESPFVFALTSRGLNPKFFKFEVTTGYWIKPYFGDQYGELAAVLNTGANTGAKLIPAVFLEQLNNALPTSAKPERNPSPQRIIELRQDITEDRERPYFDTWVLWRSKDRKGPSSDNLCKTLLLLGREAYKHSLAIKASTRWSATPTGRSWTEEVSR